MTRRDTQHSELKLARSLARQAHASVGSLPSAAFDKAKTCLIDFLACAFEAGPLPWSRHAIAMARPLRNGARIIGTDIVAHPCDAAFANAVLGHGLVREDMHAGSISHHGVVVWPSLLALADECDVTGMQFLQSAIIAYEAGAQVGRALFNAELARLFRPTGLVGPIGATLGASIMLGASEDAAAHALSLVINTVGGLNQWPHTGGSEMYFHPGFAARNVITCIALAQAGAFASEDIFEGEAGLFAAFRRAGPSMPVALFADGRAEILEVYNKPVPACNFAQTACQAAAQIARELGEERGGIAAVEVRVSDAAIRYPGCDFRGPYERALQAKMSIQYGVAAALARGAVEEANYAALDDREIRRLIGVMTMDAAPDFTAAFPGKQGSAVSVVLADGRRLARRLDDVVAATPDQVRIRFRAAAAVVVGEDRARAIETIVDQLVTMPDVRPLLAACGPSAASSRARPAATAAMEGAGMR